MSLQLGKTRLRWILASASPRRREILGKLGKAFDVIPSTFAEDLDKGLSPADYVLATAHAKTSQVYHDLGGDLLVIGADTIISFNGEILEKPKDKQHAFNMLKSLSGKTHLVQTACVARGRCHYIEFVRR